MTISCYFNCNIFKRIILYFFFCPKIFILLISFIVTLHCDFKWLFFQIQAAQQLNEQNMQSLSTLRDSEPAAPTRKYVSLWTAPTWRNLENSLTRQDFPISSVLQKTFRWGAPTPNRRSPFIPRREGNKAAGRQAQQFPLPFLSNVFYVFLLSVSCVFLLSVKSVLKDP